MEMHQIRYFLAIADLGSFTEAAERCHVSQPSLSSQIAKLEAEVGGALFERRHSGSVLTARGKLLLPRLREIERTLERIGQDVKDLDGLEGGIIRFGCLPTTGAYLLPSLLRDFRERYPKLTLKLQEDSSPLLASALLQGELDLALVDEAGLGTGLRGWPLFTEPLVAAVPPEHRLAKQGAVALEALADEPLIVMKSGHGFRTIVLEAFRSRGIVPHIVYESSGIETVQALVLAGWGVSLVPRLVKRPDGPLYLDLLPPTPTRTLFIAARATDPLSPASLIWERQVKAWFNSGSFGDHRG